MPSGSEPAEGKGYASIFRDNRFEAWIPEHRKSYSQLHLQTISGGKSLHRYSSRYSAMGKSSPTLPTTRTQLVQLGTSRLPVNREGAPSASQSLYASFSTNSRLLSYRKSGVSSSGCCSSNSRDSSVIMVPPIWNRESGPDLAPAVWSTVTILRVQCPPSGVAALSGSSSPGRCFVPQNEGSLKRHERCLRAAERGAACSRPPGDLPEPKHCR